MTINKYLEGINMLTLTKDVTHNFDLSIIMSFYKRYDEFAKALLINSKYFQRNGIEVIIILDDYSEKEVLLNLVKQYPFINWKIIANNRMHPPRNHAPVLNIGLKNATKKYVMQIDPEVEFLSDIIWQMRSILEYYPKHYAIAQMAYVNDNEVITTEVIKKLSFMPYGNIMIERKILYEINGYDETFYKWGGEDDNLRARLNMRGVKGLILSDALTVHREKKYNPDSRLKKIKSHTLDSCRKIYYPKQDIVNINKWGEEFDNIIYSWDNNPYSYDQCLQFINRFNKYSLCTQKENQRKYKKLLLCQAYNEERFIEGFLKDMEQHFDGIILLDDGSSDNTWDLAIHQKILLKVQKKHNGFNDLENRNILLDLASFFRSEWICFMDIDERFDNKYSNFKIFENNPNIHSVAFRAIYLWNNDKTYKAGIPFAPHGIFHTTRMFRNIGHCQIYTKHKLHFAPTPYVENIHMSQILFKDHGSMLLSDRKKKYKMYNEEDTQNDLRGSYDYLLNNDQLHSVDDIKT